MRRALLLLTAALLASLGAAVAQEYPVAGEVTGPFKVRITRAEPLDASEYAVIIGDKYVTLIMVEKDDLQQGSGAFKTQPFLVPVPKELVKIEGTRVSFSEKVVGDTFSGYCLNPSGRHPIGEMVVPKWSEIENRCIKVKVVTGPSQVKTEERYLTPEWVKAVCKRVEGVVTPKRWERSAQTIVWVTEAVVPQQPGQRVRVTVDVQATVNVNANDFFELNRSEFQELAKAGGEVAREILEFFSRRENLEELVNTAQAALDFVKRHLSDLVTVARTAKSFFEKIPVSPVVAALAAVLPVLRRRR